MKIGIMTMHRVQNMGSVLQAYALQYKIQQLGYESELIDYVFPPMDGKQSISWREGYRWMLNFLQGCPHEKKIRKLELFRKEYLRCSEKTYNRESLHENPPKYDVYFTGSDQVWNPFHVGEDTSFMLDFVPIDAPRIAYASSFASKEISEPYFSLYAKNLALYQNISVREQSGVDIVKQMTGKDAEVVCDPTLLLTAKEWGTIADASDMKIQGAYIFVYMMGYMFNPRSCIYKFAESVRQEMNIPVYQFNPYTKDRFHRHIKALQGMGPADFVNLIRNASFVITDSFHGAAFATIFNIPMIGLIKDEEKGDGRIATLREEVGGKKSIVPVNHSFNLSPFIIDQYKCKPDLLEHFRNESLEELNNMLHAVKSHV